MKTVVNIVTMGCIFIFVVLLTACSSMTSPARDHEIGKDGKLTWVDFAADRRGAWIVTNPASGTSPASGISQAAVIVKICAEPFPDAAEKFKGTGSGSNAGSTVQISAEQTTIELSGRSPSLLALREALYRICELNMMGAITEPSTVELFSKALSTLDKVAETEMAASPAAGIIHNIAAAHKYEAAGFEALLTDHWGDAQDAFDKSEQAYPSFHGSYEFVLALKQNKENVAKAKALLDSRAADYLPSAVKKHLQSVK